jgi:hypothetical protein
MSNNSPELLDEIRKSLEHTIHVLNGILNEVKAGTYTKEQAALDVEDIMAHEGFGYVSALLDYADGATDESP